MRLRDLKVGDIVVPQPKRFIEPGGIAEVLWLRPDLAGCVTTGGELRLLCGREIYAVVGSTREER